MKRLLITLSLCLGLHGCMDNEYNPSNRSPAQKIDYEDGRKAREAGIPASGNPYRSGNNYHRSWRDGWLSKDSEIKEQEKKKSDKGKVE